MFLRHLQTLESHLLEFFDKIVSKTNNTNYKIGYLQWKCVENVALIDMSWKSTCLICNATIPNYKVSNLLRRYEVRHSHISTQYPLDSKLRTEKLTSLQYVFYKQQQLLSFSVTKIKKTIIGSFPTAYNIARAKRQYGGEFIKRIYKKKWKQTLNY